MQPAQNLRPAFPWSIAETGEWFSAAAMACFVSSFIRQGYARDSLDRWSV